MTTGRSIAQALALEHLFEPEAPRAYFLIGPPGSGKTTWRREYLARSCRPVVALSSDDALEDFAAAHAVTLNEAYYRADLKTIEREMKLHLEQAVAEGVTVILDRTNMRRKGRSPWLYRVAGNYRRVAMVFQTTDLAELYRRLDERAARTGKVIPRRVVEEMLAGFQPPTAEEGFKDVLPVTLGK